MASSIVTLKRVLASSTSKLKCASTRGFCQSSRSDLLQQLESHLQDLHRSLYPSIVKLESFFFAPDNREINHSCRRGAGVFLDSTLIVTSAHVVGRLSTFYESKNVGKPDRFEHGSILHNSYIGSTAAITGDLRLLKTRPVAVNFVSDVAVLKVVMPEETLFPHCLIANSLPRKDDILIGFPHEGSPVPVIKFGNVRAIGEKTIRAKAPWPLDNELGWMEHDWSMFGGGNPPPLGTLLNSREKVTGSITRVTGSPWFNLHGEVVGIASWEVTDQPAQFSVGFAVPPLSIRSVVEYAKTKQPEDPVVMDSWIDSHMLPGD